MSTSTRESRRHHFVGDVRSSKKRKMVGNANRNKATSENSTANVNTLAVERCEQGGSMSHVPIDVDAIDDDVLVSSPMAFAQARNNSRRNRERTAIIDVESGVAEEERMVAECLSSLSRAAAAEERMCTVDSRSHNKRRRVPSGQTIIDCDLYVCLEGPSRMIGESVQRVQPPSPLPPPPPKEPTFSCPICMGSIDEAMSTKCGHIFCQACLKAAVAAQKKCPTCRTKITTMKSTIRVYLPTTR